MSDEGKKTTSPQYRALFEGTVYAPAPKFSRKGKNPEQFILMDCNQKELAYLHSLGVAEVEKLS